MTLSEIVLFPLTHRMVSEQSLRDMANHAYAMIEQARPFALRPPGPAKAVAKRARKGQTGRTER